MSVLSESSVRVQWSDSAICRWRPEWCAGEPPALNEEHAIDQYNTDARWDQISVVCAQGYVRRAEAGSDVCTPCAPGTFADELDSVNCTACPADTYQTGSAAAACEPCPAGVSYTNGSVGATRCLASPGYFYLGRNDGGGEGLGKGEGLGEGGGGGGGGVADVQQYLQCSPAESCVGNNRCAPGYGAELCGACADSYYRSRESCEECPTDDSLVGVGVGSVALLLVGLVLLKFGLRVLRTLAHGGVSLKGPVMLFNFIQISELLFGFNLGWPAFVKDFFEFLKIFRISLPELLRAECVNPVLGNYVFRFCLAQATPVFLALLIGVYAALAVAHAGIVKSLAGVLNRNFPRITGWAYRHELEATVYKQLHSRELEALVGTADWRERVAPQAMTLLQLWDMLSLDSLHDKYLRPVGTREVRRIFGRLLVATAAGEATPAALHELAARASPLRQCIGFDDGRKQAKRERAAIGLIHALRVQTETALKKQAGGGGPMLEEYAVKQELAKLVYQHMAALRKLSPAASDNSGAKGHASFVSTRAEAAAECRRVLDACRARGGGAQVAPAHKPSKAGAIATKVMHMRPLMGLLRAAIFGLLRCRCRDELASLRRSLLGLFVIGLVVLYIPIAEVALQPFACQRGNDGVWRMTAASASTIECFDFEAADGDWVRLQGPAYFALLFYVFGIPFGVFCALCVGYQLSEGRRPPCWPYRRVLSRGMLPRPAVEGGLWAAVHVVPPPELPVGGGDDDPQGGARAGARLLRDGAGGAAVVRVHHPYRLARDAADALAVHAQARELDRELLADRPRLRRAARHRLPRAERP